MTKNLVGVCQISAIHLNVKDSQGATLNKNHYSRT